jgi:hypothetical protein
MIEKLQVIAQPHRRGDLDQFCEGPAGRFVLKHQLLRPIYDAICEYGDLVRHFQAAKVGTKPVVSLGFGSGMGVSPRKAKWLAEEVSWIESTLRSISMVGFRAVKDLAVFETPVPPGSAPEVIGVLYGLARLLRKIDDRHARIQGWREA